MTPAPLNPIAFPSIYKSGGQFAPVPARMAKCTPDTKAALFGLQADVEKLGGVLRLSDLFRSYDMQLQAHLDYTSGKKKAYSPPPGGSMHEAGRAFDIDLSALKIKLETFWTLAKARHVEPIIAKPDPAISEAWHFECRGSFSLVRDYYATGKGDNLKPARAMAVAAIAALGQEVDDFKGRNLELRFQSALIRLGGDPGNLDGTPGPKTDKAASALGMTGSDLSAKLDKAESMLRGKFPSEWFDKTLMPEELPQHG
jgi:hypothetical protein